MTKKFAIVLKKQRGVYRLLLLFLIFFRITSGEVVAEELIARGEILALSKCIDIALQKHPHILAAKNNLDVNKSRIGQAKADYYPQLKLSGGASRTSSSSGKIPSYSEYSSSVTLSQNIFDFNRREIRVDIEGLNLEASRGELNNVSLNVALGVKQAYYELLRAKKTREISAETVKRFERHLERAKGFFETGLKPKFDVTKAEVELSNARLNLLKADNALRIAVVVLNNAMGAPDAPPYDLENDVLSRKYAVDLSESLKKAYLARPDLHSLLLKKEAARKSVQLAGRDYYPALSGKASYGWSGDDFPLERSWNIGASLDFELFSGFSTRYKLEEARAGLEVLRAQEEALRQEIRLEVEQSVANLQEAEKRISVTETTVRQAEENLELAQGRYAAGVGDPLEMTDALVAAGNAKTALAGALYDYKITGAFLDKAMGEK